MNNKLLSNGSGIVFVVLGLIMPSCKLTDVSKDKDCPIGMERCPCTQGGVCDPGLTCLSNFCVNAEGGSGAAGDDSNFQGTGDDEKSRGTCPGYCSTIEEKCNLSSDDYDWCMEDCEDRRKKIPDQCLNLYDEALACMESPEAWECEGDQAIRVGCDAEEKAYLDCSTELDEECADTVAFMCSCFASVDSPCNDEEITMLYDICIESQDNNVRCWADYSDCIEAMENCPIEN